MIIILIVGVNFINCGSACDHPIYCEDGDDTILHTIQMAKIFHDGKTFVDMPMRFAADEIKKNFANLPDKTFDTLKKFVADNFHDY